MYIYVQVRLLTGFGANMYDFAAPANATEAAAAAFAAAAAAAAGAPGAPGAPPLEDDWLAVAAAAGFLRRPPAGAADAGAGELLPLAAVRRARRAAARSLSLSLSLSLRPDGPFSVRRAAARRAMRAVAPHVCARA